MMQLRSARSLCVFAGFSLLLGLPFLQSACLVCSFPHALPTHCSERSPRPPNCCITTNAFGDRNAALQRPYRREREGHQGAQFCLCLHLVCATLCVCACILRFRVLCLRVRLVCACCTCRVWMHLGCPSCDPCCARQQHARSGAVLLAAHACLCSRHPVRAQHYGAQCSVQDDTSLWSRV